MTRHIHWQIDPPVVFKHNDVYTYEVPSLLTVEGTEKEYTALSLSFTLSPNICYWAKSETGYRAGRIFELSHLSLCSHLKD